MKKPDKIIIAPNSLLKKKARQVKILTSGKKKRIIHMLDLMHASGGCGLAAPQIGWDFQIFVVGLKDEHLKLHEFVFINPEITFRSEETSVEAEGCLSLPGIQIDVERPVRIVVKAKDLDDSMFEMEVDGMLARCVQHEYDHLSGILLTDLAKCNLPVK
tara:strand:+ start:17501 stop:17977 length:477 start_codon:yes stop_codon:yes gene_type:complete